MTKVKTSPGMQFFIKNDAYRAQRLYIMIASISEAYTYLILDFAQQAFDIRMTTLISFYTTEILNEACWSRSGHDVSCLIQDRAADACVWTADHSLNRAAVVNVLDSWDIWCNFFSQSFQLSAHRVHLSVWQFANLYTEYLVWCEVKREDKRTRWSVHAITFR